jgi:cell division protein FtsZ
MGQATSSASMGGGLTGVSAMGAGSSSHANTDYASLSTPSVWRNTRTHASEKVNALQSGGMDELDIPAFLRKQAD